MIYLISNHVILNIRIEGANNESVSNIAPSLLYCGEHKQQFSHFNGLINQPIKTNTQIKWYSIFENSEFVMEHKIGGGGIVRSMASDRGMLEGGGVF